MLSMGTYFLTNEYMQIPFLSIGTYFLINEYMQIHFLAQEYQFIHYYRNMY
jgi:hypothetical protein